MKWVIAFAMSHHIISLQLICFIISFLHFSIHFGNERQANEEGEIDERNDGMTTASNYLHFAINYEWNAADASMKWLINSSEARAERNANESKTIERSEEWNEWNCLMEWSACATAAAGAHHLLHSVNYIQ